MRTSVYIDGGNLYHGLLRYHPELKWLNLEKFARALVREDHEINAIKYFTSRIKTHPYIGPLDRIRGELGKQVVVFNPRNCESDLMYHANYYRTIPADLAASCQLPDTVKVGSRTFTRPPEWRS